MRCFTVNGAQANQKMRRALLAEERREGGELSARNCQARAHVRAAAGSAHRCEQCFNVAFTLFIKAFGKAAADEALGADAEDLTRRGIRRRDLVRERIDDEHGFARNLEQQPEASLSVPQMSRLLLQRLLDIHQSLLQRLNNPQITAHRDNAALSSHLNGAVQNRYIRAARRGVVDLAPASLRLRRRTLKQCYNSWSALERDRVGPRPAKPLARDILG